MNTLLQDIRYALRQLRKSPGFTLTAVVTLALGIGANTAIFNVVNTTFLRALPYPDSGRLLWITERNSISNRDSSVSYPNFLDWRAQQDSFSELAIYQFDSGALKTAEGVERVPTLMVSDNFFAALGVHITQGRGMIAADDKAGAAPVGWLSHAAWQRYFAADPSLVGRTVSLDGQSIAVAGILPADFRFSQPADVYLPVAQYVDQLFMKPRNNRRNTFVVGRLKPGVTLETARSQMDTIARRLQALYPEANTGIVANVMPLREHLAGPARTQIFLLLGAVGAILLIACVNLANMLLARSAGRRREMAIRASLGASRFQLMRQLLAESLLLAIGGGALGLLFGLGVYNLVFRLVPFEMQQLASAGGGGLDLRVLLFAVIVTLVTGIGFGLAPAWQLSHANPSDALKSTESVAHTHGGRFRAGDLLVVSQVALAFTLLVSAGLLIRTLARLARVDPGFKPEHVLSLKLSPPPLEQFWHSPLSFAAYYERILDTVGNRPEVNGCGVVTGLPFSGNGSTVGFYPEGRPDPAEANVPNASVQFVSAGYFRAMGIPLVRGRLLSGREPQPVVPAVGIKPQDFLAIFKDVTLDGVISQRTAKEFWPGEDPVGKRFRLKSAPNVPRPVVQIVGVVGDTTQFGLDQGENPEFYLSLHQIPVPGDMFLAIRTNGDPASLTASVRAILRPVTGDQPITDVRPMTARIADTLTGRRFNMNLFTFFAGTALLLALVGIYGVLAFTISRRTCEMGIRMALGASRARILRGVLWRGFRLVLPGILVGLAGAWAVGRLLQCSLFGITRGDPVTYIGSTGAFLLVAFLACLLPARRAASIEPMQALRSE
jgi:putative ABC transport system permease protein